MYRNFSRLLNLRLDVKDHGLIVFVPRNWGQLVHVYTNLCVVYKLVYH